MTGHNTRPSDGTVEASIDELSRSGSSGSPFYMKPPNLNRSLEYVKLRPFLDSIKEGRCNVFHSHTKAFGGTKLAYFQDIEISNEPSCMIN